MSDPERVWLDKTHRWLDGATNTSDDACILDWRVNEVKVSRSTEYVRADLTLSPNELRQVREALTECADDLAAYVEHEYPERFRDAVPSEDRRYKRDIEPVNRARAALAILASKEPKA